MKISRSPGLMAVLLLPLLGSAWSTSGYAQDEGGASDDANVGPVPESVQDGAEIPPASPPPSYDSPSPDSTDQPPMDSSGEAIPSEIQAEVNGEDSGPPVDESYNSLSNPGESFFSQVYIGPTVQVGFPNPLTYGLEALFARTVSVGFSGGNYTVDEIDKAELKIKGWDLHARWHPWMGSFFVGASYGRMELDGQYEDTYTARISGFERQVTARVNASIETNYFAPRLGWFAVWDSGLCVGFDIGVQIPLGPDTKVVATVPGATAAEEAQIKATSEYKDLEDQADDTVKVLGKRTIPVATLFRVGWLF